MTELRQKAQARIQFFNVKVTRQEEKGDQVSSSQDNRLRLAIVDGTNLPFGDLAVSTC